MLSTYGICLNTGGSTYLYVCGKCSEKLMRLWKVLDPNLFNGRKWSSGGGGGGGGGGGKSVTYYGLITPGAQSSPV